MVAAVGLLRVRALPCVRVPLIRYLRILQLFLQKPALLISSKRHVSHILALLGLIVWRPHHSIIQFLQVCTLAG